MQIPIDLHDHLYLSEADLRRELAIARESNAVSGQSRDQKVNDYTCEVLNGNPGAIVGMNLEEQEV